MSSLLISLLVPIQIHFSNPESRFVGITWFSEAIVDCARVIGLPTYRNKVALIAINPELNLRDETKEDKPLTRRRQFIQNLVNNSVSIATR